jgi:2-polyprenyl-3-methyl-5-hydroxy-6-metoxy-1,4-benzoquinol methylase
METNLATGTAADAADGEAAFGARIREAAVGAFETASLVIGLRLGLFDGLRAGGPQTASELAARTHTAARPVREWLEQAAAAGFLELASAADDPDARRFALPDAHARVLLDRDTGVFLGTLPIQVYAALQSIDLVVESVRTGSGFPFAAAGDDMRTGEGEGNRAAYLGPLGREWLPSIADLDARLRAMPPARIADLGCGYGWSSVGMALAYPLVSVDGVDLDEASVEVASRHAREAGVADRVRFALGDAAAPPLDGPYELVTIFEAFHDMSQPVRILARARQLLADGGSVLIIDSRTNERFEPPSDLQERYWYGWSVMECLHGSLQGGGVGTGTVMRPGTLRGYAHEAGLSRVEVLPIEHESWRFYRLRP